MRRDECQVSSDKWTEKNMKKQITVFTLCAILFALGTSASAQQAKKLSQIGYLSSRDRTSDAERSEAVRAGLRELGYIEGKNIVIEYRYADGKREQFRSLPLSSCVSRSNSSW